MNLELSRLTSSVQSDWLKTYGTFPDLICKP